MEHDIEKKLDEIDKTNHKLAINLLFHFVSKHLLKSLNAIISINLKKRAIPKTSLPLRIDTKQTTSCKMNLSKSTCSGIPSNITIRGDIDPIIDTKENLDQSSNSIDNTPQPLEEIEELVNIDLTYLLSAEEKVNPLLIHRMPYCLSS